MWGRGKKGTWGWTHPLIYQEKEILRSREGEKITIFNRKKGGRGNHPLVGGRIVLVKRGGGTPLWSRQGGRNEQTAFANYIHCCWKATRYSYVSERGNVLTSKGGKGEFVSKPPMRVICQAQGGKKEEGIS